jgi:hypothetical protein
MMNGIAEKDSSLQDKDQPLTLGAGPRVRLERHPRLTLPSVPAGHRVTSSDRTGHAGGEIDRHNRARIRYHF